MTRLLRSHRRESDKAGVCDAVGGVSVPLARPCPFGAADASSAEEGAWARRGQLAVVIAMLHRDGEYAAEMATGGARAAGPHTQQSPAPLGCTVPASPTQESPSR